MLKKWTLGLLTVISCVTSFGAHAEPDVAAGKQKAGACASCHGMDGNSTQMAQAGQAIPKLAGQHHKYLYDQLVEYSKGADGRRNVPLMYPFASSLSDQDKQDVAAYFSSLPSSEGTTPQKYYSLGERLYKGGDISKGIAACMACHGPRGLGNEQAGFPKLSGQYAAYVLAQLKAYASGERKSSHNGMMNDLSKKMTPEEMEAVSHYVAGLH